MEEQLFAEKIQMEKVYGLIDENGKEILPCNYLRVDDFVNGLSVVKIKEGPLDIVDVNGEIKITGSETPWSKVGDIMGDSYIRIGDDSGNFGVARIEELKSGRTVIPLEYSQIAWAGNGFKVAKKSGWGVRSVDGEEIVPCRYNTVWSVGEGSIYLCVERGQDVKEGGAYTVFSSTGEKLGEYKGTEREWVWEELVVLSSKSSVDNNLTDITVLNKFGDILLQQTCSSHSIWANGNYAIKVNERESVAGNLLTDYPAMEIKNGSADAGTDSIIRRDKQKSTVYRSQGGEMTEVLALDADISFQKSRPNRTLKDLEVRNDSAWIPWLANQTYHIGILD